MMLPPKHHDQAIWVVIAIILLLSIGNFVFTQIEISQLKKNVITIPTIPTALPTPSPFPLPLPTLTPATNLVTPTPKVIYVTPTPQTISQITYIPLTGGSTQNTDWTNIPSSSFSLNTSDYAGGTSSAYGTKAYAICDANLRVDNANGETFARLFDTTHGIAVNGSEINISNTSTSTDVISGSLSFWAGNNTYVVQVKSLTSSTAYVDSGRIKITY